MQIVYCYSDKVSFLGYRLSTIPRGYLGFNISVYSFDLSFHQRFCLRSVCFSWEAHNAPRYRPDSLSVQSFTSELETQSTQQQFENQRREMENSQRQAEEDQREADRQQMQRQQQLNELCSINHSLGGY